MIFTNGERYGFDRSEQVDALSISHWRNHYLFDSLKVTVPLFIILGLILGFGISGFDSRFVTPMGMTIIGCAIAPVELFLFSRIISVIAGAIMMRRGNFTWKLETVTGYTLQGRNRNVFLYAVIDEKYYCNTWNNPHYKKGTSVYFISINSWILQTNLMIKAD